MTKVTLLSEIVVERKSREVAKKFSWKNGT